MVRHLGGWWRLWIVLTIIYGAVVLAYTWLSWPSVASVRHDNRFLRQMSDDALLVLSRPKSKMTKDGWESAPIVLEMPNSFAFEVAGDTPDERAVVLAKDYVRVLESVVREFREKYGSKIPIEEAHQIVEKIERRLGRVA